MNSICRLSLWTACGLLLAGVVGCSNKTGAVRSQSDDDADKERYPVKTVGDVSTFGNAAPVPVSGVGLVEGLENTGGPAPNGPARQTLENELRKQKIENPKALINSPECAMVLVSGLIPAGAKKGDLIDLEITLPPGSKATSLRGGTLRRCSLFNYDYAANLNSQYEGSNATVRGHPIARAQGPLLVSFGGEEKDLKRARIWEGGTCMIDRPFQVLMNAKHQSARVASVVADRINAAFQIAGGAGTEMASAKSKEYVLLGVPAQYKLNLPRYLRVVRMIPVEETAPVEKNGAKKLPYAAQLGEDLMDPARAVTAAHRLEALGAPSIPALKRGLTSKHPLVRFCSAEALAYLGSPTCAEELARAVQQQPYMRAYALTALASLDEAACHVKLRDLLVCDADEVRYGAFRALRTLDERDPVIRGERLGDSFWVHQVAKESNPLVHVSLSRRAEIVLFGPTPKLVPPLAIRAGEFAITAAEGDERCTITYVPLFSGDGDGSRMRCSLDLMEVIQAMASQGASYAEVVEMLGQADSCRNLTCRVRTDALPQVASVQQLAAAGREGTKPKVKNFDKPNDEIEIIKPEAEMGATPTLYQQTTKPRTPAAKKAPSFINDAE